MPIREDASFVMERATSVRLDDSAIDDALRSVIFPGLLQSAQKKTPHRDPVFHILFSAMNFCYWPDPAWGQTIFEDRFASVYGKPGPFADLEACRRISADTFAERFSSPSPIPYLEVRRNNLRQAATSLVTGFKGSGEQFLAAACYDAGKIASLLVESIALFADQTVYGGRNVAFHKKAQLCAARLAADDSRIGGLDQLTAFADYRVPQVLHHLGILVYRDDVRARVYAEEEIPAGSVEEVEIRAATVLAVERVRQRLVSAYNRESAAAEIDGVLWKFAQKQRHTMKPHPRVRTVHY